jgi:hypothetical protein
MRAPIAVQVGDLWQDNDKRRTKVRTLRIDALGFSMACCTVVETGRHVRIQFRRFRPTSNGYRLVEKKS